MLGGAFQGALVEGIGAFVLVLAVSPSRSIRGPAVGAPRGRLALAFPGFLSCR